MGRDIPYRTFCPGDKIDEFGFTVEGFRKLALTGKNFSSPEVPELRGCFINKLPEEFLVNRRVF
jgi:hypothetical protein